MIDLLYAPTYTGTDLLAEIASGTLPILAALCAAWAWRRADDSGRSKWIWVPVCLITGPIGAAALWSVSRSDTDLAPKGPPSASICPSTDERSAAVERLKRKS